MGFDFMGDVKVKFNCHFWLLVAPAAGEFNNFVGRIRKKFNKFWHKMFHNCGSYSHINFEFFSNGF